MGECGGGGGVGEVGRGEVVGGLVLSGWHARGMLRGESARHELDWVTFEVVS